MENRIKPVFDRIHAEDSLKQKTKACLSQKIRNEHKRVSPVAFGKPIAALCALVLLLGICWIYHIPTASISIDINPSVELSLNCFDRVISARAYNQDGQVLLEQVRLVHLHYEEAVEKVLKEDTVTELLSTGEMVMLSVIGPEGSQVERIISGMEACTVDTEQTRCCYTSPETAEQAHNAGLSAGTYRAFLELQEWNPDVTVEDVRDLTMRQIRDLIEQFKTIDTETSDLEDTQNPGQHGNGNSAEKGSNNQSGENGGDQSSGNGKGAGNGTGNGNGNGYRGGR